MPRQLGGVCLGGNKNQKRRDINSINHWADAYTISCGTPSNFAGEQERMVKADICLRQDLKLVIIFIYLFIYFYFLGVLLMLGQNAQGNYVQREHTE